jgi:aspartate aminotransferase-like enzyme
MTAVHVPEGVSALEVKRRLLAEHGIAIAAGVGASKDRLLRIAHMGYCGSADIEEVLDALEAVLGCR